VGKQTPVTRWNPRLRKATDTTVLRLACEAFDTLPYSTLELLGSHPLLTGEVEDYFLQQLVAQQRLAPPDSAPSLPTSIWAALYASPSRWADRIAAIWPKINPGWQLDFLEDPRCPPACAEFVIQQIVSRKAVDDACPDGADSMTQGKVSRQNLVRWSLLRKALAFPGINPAVLEPVSRHEPWAAWAPVFLLTCPASTTEQRRRWIRGLRKGWHQEHGPKGMYESAPFVRALSNVYAEGGMTNEDERALEPGTLLRLLDGCSPYHLSGRLRNATLVTRRLYVRNLLTHWDTHHTLEQLPASDVDPYNWTVRAWTQQLEMLLPDASVAQQEISRLITALMPYAPKSVIHTLRTWGQQHPTAEEASYLSSWLRPALNHNSKHVRLDAIRLLGEMAAATKANAPVEGEGKDQSKSAHEQGTLPSRLSGRGRTTTDATAAVNPRGRERK